MTNKNYEDMLAGHLYSGADPYLYDLKLKASAAKARLDAISNEDIPARIEAVKDLLAEGSGPAIVLSPFNIQYGRHVKLGSWTFVNYGATFLDANMITLGNFVAVAPNVQFITDTHPVRPEERFLPPREGDTLPFRVGCSALPITVGDYAWIGAGAIILPGVTIGEGAVIGAGSVVTKDIAPRMIAVGNPARELRSVDD